MIHVLAGDGFQVEREYRRLRAALLGPSLQEFNLDLLEGRETTAVRILECCRLLPVLAKCRVVVVREADQIPKGELEKLEASLEEIARSSELILLAEKPDRRVRFWQRIAAVARWREFRPLYPREISAWIREEEKKIRPEAVDWLAGRFGSEQGLIASTLEKARLLGGTTEITVGDLEAVTGPFPFRSVFDLTDAIGSRERSRALSLLARILSSGEHPVGLLTLIARHFRILLKVKETGQGAPPYFLKNYQEQSKGFTRRMLRQGVERIFKTDWELKSSRLAPPLVLERLIWDLCRR